MTPAQSLTQPTRKARLHAHRVEAGKAIAQKPISGRWLKPSFPHALRSRLASSPGRTVAAWTSPMFSEHMEENYARTQMPRRPPTEATPEARAQFQKGCETRFLVESVLGWGFSGFFGGVVVVSGCGFFAEIGERGGVFLWGGGRTLLVYECFSVCSCSLGCWDGAVVSAGECGGFGGVGWGWGCSFGCGADVSWFVSGG